MTDVTEASPPSSAAGAKPAEGSPTAAGEAAPSRGEARRDQPAEAMDDVAQVERLCRAHRQVREEIKKRIVGQDDVIELMLVCLFARGHGLFVGVPGLAKTLLITTLAETLSLRSQRIQFTPDLMPSDITGTDVLEEDATTGRRHFRFVPGPAFTHMLLADEINRTPPKTQAALLQAMAEGQVTAGSKTYPLEPPYIVFATQNPIEQEGTYPLPEAQLDRFLFQIDVDYPSEAEEAAIVALTTAPPGPQPSPVAQREDILAFQDLVPRVPVAPHVVAHAVKLVRATRPDGRGADNARGQGAQRGSGGVSLVDDYVAFGAGPRASQALVIAAKARAVLDGRFAAEVEDVRSLAAPVLKHRIVMNFRGEAERVGVGQVVEHLLSTVVP